MSADRAIIFAGGGSGGHISPGLAIAERLAEISPATQSIFICSQRAIDATMLRDAGAEFVAVPATPPSMKPPAAVRFIMNFYRSKRVVMKVIQQRNVKWVVTLGGFVAAPAVSAAQACGVSVMLVNLDTPPGKANVWMAKRSEKVISAIDLPSMPGFASQVVGMPIRRKAVADVDQRTCRVQLGLHPELPTLLITGASQGATSINALMIALAAQHPSLFNGWQVYHLTGHGGDESVRDAYLAADIKARAEPFLDQIGLAWGAADLAISRAGASSVAEAAANAVPTLFLPYPYHRDMHQKHNAQPLVNLGGAAMAIDQIDANRNVQMHYQLLHDLMTGTSHRSAMRAALRSHSFPDAAMTIAQMLAPLQDSFANTDEGDERR